MRYRVDVKVEGYILVEANDPFEAHKIADMHQEDMKIEYVEAVSVERKQQDGEYQVDLDAPY